MSLVDQAKSIKEIINRIAQQAKPTTQDTQQAAQQGAKTLMPNGNAPTITPDIINQQFIPVMTVLNRENNQQNFMTGLDGLGNKINLIFSKNKKPSENSTPENIAALKAILDKIEFQRASKSKEALLVKSPILSSILPDFLPEGGSAAPKQNAAPNATPQSTDNNLGFDIPAKQKELELASRIVTGIKQALAKPGANRTVLLWRLNKYRLIPMAQIFNSMIDISTKELEDFHSRLEGLFEQVKSSFGPEDLKELQKNPEVAKALESLEENTTPRETPLKASFSNKIFIKNAALIKKYS